MRHITLISALVLVVGLLSACTPVNTREQPEDRKARRLVELQIQLGVGYMQEGNYEVAMKRMKRALELSPDSADAHNAIALLYQRTNQNDKAEQHFQDAIRLDPDFSSAHTNYGSFLCSTDRPAEGEKEFLAAVKNPMYRKKALAYMNAGTCMMRYSEMDKAEEYFRYVIREEPRNSIALVRMCRLSFERGRYLPARGYLQRYQEVGKRTPESLWLGYRIETELGDKNAASSYALSLRGSFPDADETRQLDESEKE
ncbi:MAG: type IV pilus biogenesis/stability protein PilW [Gammaproteobacteria bacterium]|nr:type IV pilus biogenesis/stability protein PilW [Gammaproteobacteria bacterium]